MNARQAVFTSLQRYSSDKKYANIELSGAIERYGLSGVEKSFFTALFYGVVERELTLDSIISEYSSRPSDEIDENIKIILRIGLYQLLYMSKVPESAAVDETVALAHRFNQKKNSSAFINAVLREFLRKDKHISYPDRKKDAVSYYSVFYSLPAWLVSLWISAYGEERAVSLFESTFLRPPLTVRTNTLKITRDGLLSRLLSDGIKAEATSSAPHGINISAPAEILGAYQGLMFVQDEASQLCVSALGAKPGDTVLDVCAAPGGKSFSAACDINDLGRVLAYDIHKNKLSLITRTAASLGITCISASERDASSPDGAPRAEKILCDVPCSGLGVINKKPDIRRKNFSDIERLPSIQKKILDASSGLLLPGGTLVYSTCTLNPAENKLITDDFLASHPDFRAEGFSVGGKSYEGITELYPDGGTDGFFIARLRRG